MNKRCDCTVVFLKSGTYDIRLIFFVVVVKPPTWFLSFWITFTSKEFGKSNAIFPIGLKCWIRANNICTLAKIFFSNTLSTFHLWIHKDILSFTIIFYFIPEKYFHFSFHTFLNLVSLARCFQFYSRWQPNFSFVFLLLELLLEVAIQFLRLTIFQQSMIQFWQEKIRKMVELNLLLINIMYIYTFLKTIPSTKSSVIDDTIDNSSISISLTQFCKISAVLSNSSLC